MALSAGVKLTGRRLAILTTTGGAGGLVADVCGLAGFDVPPPGGESLKDTAARVLPYYEAEIEPKVRAGNTVLVAAHGNSLRALVMKFEKLGPEEILKREIATGDPIVYEIGADGEVLASEAL